HVHRLHQCLITVAQIGRQPDRGTGDDGVGPGAVSEADGGEGPVFAGRVVQHDAGSNDASWGSYQQPACKQKGPLLVHTGRSGSLRLTRATLPARGTSVVELATDIA